MMISRKRARRERPPQNHLSAHQWTVDSSAKGASLADHLADRLLISSGEASDLIDFGSVHIGGRRERNPARKLSGMEAISVFWPRHGTERAYEIDPARILYRDDVLLAYDKEAGIPSQQTPSDAHNNLFAGLYRYIEKEIKSAAYVAIHHRLDRDTSGVMVFALDRSANPFLGKAFEEHKVIKDYLAWVDGQPSQTRWVADDDIGRKNSRYCVFPKGQGKPAETTFGLLHREEDRALLWARPRTGRTHQIRLHLSAGGHPVIGDRLYGGSGADRLYLHAYRLRLPHPATGSELVLTAPIPEYWPLPHSIAIPD